jgi:TIR domain
VRALLEKFAEIGVVAPPGLSNYLNSLNSLASTVTCFISYSSKDRVLAEKLQADLQNKGVRCWFAPCDLPIGAKTWDAIDDAIRLRGKLLVILSKASIGSDWVEDEVSKALAEERSRQQVVLFPIRIDNEVMSTAEPWAVKLRDQRNIGDFRRWNRAAEYGRSLERLLRDLKTGAP